ncbi:hypothetical protein HI914_01361 [Erysiphe necator]|nr:hypothetical protein HI914_01361 [Erysiphe necator]
MGYARDTKKITGTRRPLILASTYGSAAQTLQLLMPSYDTRRWEGCEKKSIFLPSNSFADRAFWTNGKGSIRQISFSDTVIEKSTWLATRQDSTVTIFRPYYKEKSSYNWKSTTCLHFNPIASFSSGDGVNVVHSDVSFNPWYPRQLVTIDSRGFWIMYELEDSHRKGPLQKVRQKVSGDSYERCSLAAPASEPPHSTDGWHKIFWAYDINTIVVCNRLNLAIFNIKLNLVKLQSPIVIPEGSEDCILDIKRSPLNSAELFVLTSSRIFWIEIVPNKLKPQDDDGLFGGIIILSCRHFRSPNDKSLSLVPVKTGKVSFLLTSAKHPIISFYFFGREAANSFYPKTLHGSLNLGCVPGIDSLILSACLLPCKITSNPSDDISNSEVQFPSDGAEFYQLWFLTPTLQLVSTLCAVRLIHLYDLLSPIPQIKPPDKKKKRRPYRTNQRILEDSFIILDEPKEDEFNNMTAQLLKISSVREEETHEDLRLSLNWRKLYQKVFPLETREIDTIVSLAESKIQTTSKFLSVVSDQIMEGLRDNRNAMILIYEICDFDPVFEDLSQVNILIKDFIKNIRMFSDFNNSKSVAVKEISLFGGAGLALEFGGLSDLACIFHHLIEIWISPLPKDVPNRFRGVRLRLIRKLALDLYLSSLGLSFQRMVSKYQDSRVIDTQGPVESGKAEINIQRPPLFPPSQRCTGNEGKGTDVHPYVSSITQTNYLETTSAPESSNEEPAFSRIRHFAISVQSNSKFKRPIFLNDWPSTPGCDPDSADSYEVFQNLFVPPGSGDQNTRRDEFQRRRKIHNPSSQNCSSNHSEPLPSSMTQETSNEIHPSQTSTSLHDSLSVNMKRKSKKKRTAGF